MARPTTPPPTDLEILEQLAFATGSERTRLERTLEGWFAEDAAQAVKRLRAMVKQVHGLRSGVPLRSKGAFACIVMLARHLRPHAPLPKECDLALTFNEDPAVVRSLLERIPLERRLPMFEAWLAEGSWSRYLMPYIDLAPAAAKLILEQARAGGELRQTLAWDGFASLRGRFPELDLVLAKFDAILAREPPPPPPKPPRVGSFRFVAPERVLPGDYDDLDPVGRSQYRKVAGSYVESGRVKNPRDFIRQLKKEELDESDAELRRWKVMRGSAHVYDLWVVWVENALFFHAGTDEVVPVSVIQGSYLPKRDEPALVDLAEDLASSERESLWSLPRRSKTSKAPRKKK